MLATLNSLNAHNLSIFQPISMILVSKFMVHRALSDKTYIRLAVPFKPRFNNLCTVQVQIVQLWRFLKPPIHKSHRHSTMIETHFYRTGSKISQK